jgi:hypothetical protein
MRHEHHNWLVCARTALIPLAFWQLGMVRAALQLCPVLVLSKCCGFTLGSCLRLRLSSAGCRLQLVTFLCGISSNSPTRLRCVSLKMSTVRKKLATSGKCHGALSNIRWSTDDLAMVYKQLEVRPNAACHGFSWSCNHETHFTCRKNPANSHPRRKLFVPG